MTTPSDAAPCACSLDPSALAARVEAWRRVTARATSREVERDRVVGIYPNDPAFLAELRSLIEAEAECCSFLEFTLEVRSDHVVSELRLPASVPEALRNLIIDLVGAPDRLLT